MLDASWQDHFDNWNVQPLRLVYEDYVKDFKGTVEEVLSYLGIDDAYEFQSSKIGKAKQADELSEEQVQ